MPIYSIRIRGHLPDRYTSWFNNLNIMRDPTGETLLTGELPDQGALFGVLLRIRDLGLPLLSVLCDSGQVMEDIGTFPPLRDHAAEAGINPTIEAEFRFFCKPKQLASTVFDQPEWLTNAVLLLKRMLQLWLSVVRGVAWQTNPGRYFLAYA